MNGLQRNKTIDIMKGIGIVCMVAGHAGAPVLFTHFIYLFHMPIFFMISGYLFKDTDSDSIESVKYFIVRRIKSLYFPYLLLQVLLTLFHNFLLKINFYTDNPLLQEELGGVCSLLHHIGRFRILALVF